MSKADDPVRVTVEDGDDGRVDKALARHFPDAGRKQLAELFEAGDVRVRGKRVKKGDRVAAGDVIELARAPVSGAAKNPVADADVAASLVVLVERPELVALAKPAGIPSQPLRAGERGTIANGIAHRWPECASIGASLGFAEARSGADAPRRLSASLGFAEARSGADAPRRLSDPRDGGLVHRLDIGTSGVLVAARTDAAYRELRIAFGQGRVEKVYLAITDARPVSRDCDAPLAQRGDHVRVDHTEGLAAYTQFFVERATSTHALVRCVAQTGRMHQVRAHLAHVGSPIAGDVLYGGKAIAGHEGFFLHAASLRLPLGGETLAIEAPLPARFSAALAAVGL